MSLDCMDCRALACPEFIEGLAVTKALQGPCAVSARIRPARNDNQH